MTHDALPSLGLALALGLRHGLAPDHLAVIDGLTMRALANGRRQAAWMGALFSLGHAAIMLTIIGASASAAAWFALDGQALRWLDLIEWLPGLVLLALAALNLRTLLRPAAPHKPHHPHAHRVTHGWHGLAALKTGAGGPASAVALGMLFALGAESALQAVAWGYAAAAMGDIVSGVGVAATFIVGMTLTDTLDGYATARIARAAGPQAMQALRRQLGWPVVGMCVLMGGHLLTAKACPDCALDDQLLLRLGGAMLVLTLAFYAAALLKTARR